FTPTKTPKSHGMLEKKIARQIIITESYASGILNTQSLI
ncbi:hypothetical protein HKBW3S34_02584, partial [Candidatus Hakubella thermalkaliphila]